MKLSQSGIAALKMREGRRLTAYRDTQNVFTIGYGHTSAAGPPAVISGMTITDAECDEIFARDLVKYETTVSDAIKVPIGQNQFDACVSLCYNIGQSGFAKSTVVKRINAGDMAGAAQAFMMWNKPPEIIGRRRGEMQQFMKANNGIAPPDVQPIQGAPPPAMIKPIHVAIGAGAVVAATGFAAIWQHIYGFFAHLF